MLILFDWMEEIKMEKLIDILIIKKKIEEDIEEKIQQIEVGQDGYLNFISKDDIMDILHTRLSKKELENGIKKTPICRLCGRFIDDDDIARDTCDSCLEESI